MFSQHSCRCHALPCRRRYPCSPSCADGTCHELQNKALFVRLCLSLSQPIAAVGPVCTVKLPPDRADTCRLRASSLWSKTLTGLVLSFMQRSALPKVDSEISLMLVDACAALVAVRPVLFCCSEVAGAICLFDHIH